MNQIGLHGNDGFFNCICDSFLYQSDVVTLLLQGDPKSRQKSFGAFVVLQKVLIRCLVVFRVLVQRKVGQVHEHVFHVVYSRLTVVIRAEAGQAFVCQVGLHGVEACDKYVEAQVKLLAIKEERSLNVTLH